MNVSVLCIFSTVPWVGLQCVIVVFPGHIQLIFSFDFAQLKHKKARVSRSLLQASRINILSWLYCSQGLKPIEHICDGKYFSIQNSSFQANA